MSAVSLSLAGLSLLVILGVLYYHAVTTDHAFTRKCEASGGQVVRDKVAHSTYCDVDGRAVFVR